MINEYGNDYVDEAQGMLTSERTTIYEYCHRNPSRTLCEFRKPIVLLYNFDKNNRTPRRGYYTLRAYKEQDAKFKMYGKEMLQQHPDMPLIKCDDRLLADQVFNENYFQSRKRTPTACILPLHEILDNQQSYTLVPQTINPKGNN